MTQEDLGLRSGVGLRFVRDLEQGKRTLRMDKVNQVLALFGHELGPVKSKPGRAMNRVGKVFFNDRSPDESSKMMMVTTSSTTNRISKASTLSQ